MHPCDRRGVAALREPLARELRDRRERIVVDLAARDDRHVLIEQLDELSENPALRLPAEAQQDEMMAREQRVHELGHDGVVVADDAREERLVQFQTLEQVGPDLVADAAAAERRLGPTAVPKLAERARRVQRRSHSIS